MPNRSVEQLISKIKSRGDELSARETINLSINADDLVRIKALSELYKLPIEELSAYLMSEILQQIESKIPYIAGSNVIRVEDGEPIYEDIGDTPAYLELKRKIEMALKG